MNFKGSSGDGEDDGGREDKVETSLLQTPQSPQYPKYDPTQQQENLIFFLQTVSLT